MARTNFFISVVVRHLNLISVWLQVYLKKYVEENMTQDKGHMGVLSRARKEKRKMEQSEGM